MKPTTENILNMLKESNAIEGVYDDISLEQAFRAWNYLYDFDIMTIERILHAHAILMYHHDIDYKYKGAWRDIPVWIGGEKKSQSPLVIQNQMEDWCEKTNTVDRNFDPVTLHIEFENIHPFVDGNGRMGRILLNWHLVVRNKAPLLVYTEEDKRTYYRLFRSYRAKEMEETINAVMYYMAHKEKETK